MLQKRMEREEHRETPATDSEAAREKLTAFGFDAAKSETLAKWQELGGKVDAEGSGKRPLPRNGPLPLAGGGQGAPRRSHRRTIVGPGEPAK